MKNKINYWTKDKCKEVALKCETREEFRSKYYGAYKRSRINGWYDEITKHMKIVGNRYKRLIYSYEFSNNYVYVGLTYNPKRRNNYHLNNDKSSVFRHMKKHNLIPERKILSDYVEINKAQEMEFIWLNEYKKNGWNLLNKIKTGGLGGDFIYWTKDKCHDAALKHNRRIDFAKNNVSAYISARKNEWLEDICAHMQEKKKRNYWNYNTSKKAAELCLTRFEFSRKFSRAHAISLKNKWLDEFYPKIKILNNEL